METCETCKWWNSGVSSALPEHDDTGRCVVKPPKIDKRTGLGIWPMTESGDACGAHSPAPDVSDVRSREEMREDAANARAYNDSLR